MIPVPLEMDKKINVSINLLRKKKVIKAIARVAWLSKMEAAPAQPEDRYKLGLEFIELTQEDQLCLVEELKLYYD